MLGFKKRNKTLEHLVPLKDANKKTDDKKGIYEKFSKSVKKNVRGLSQFFNYTRKQQQRSFEHGDAYPIEKKKDDNKNEIEYAQENGKIIDIIKDTKKKDAKKNAKKDTTVSRPKEYIPSDYKHLNLSDNIQLKMYSETGPIDYKNNAYSAMNPDNKKKILNPKKKDAPMYPNLDSSYKGHKFVAETALRHSRTPRTIHRPHELKKGGRRRKTRRGRSNR